MTGAPELNTQNSELPTTVAVVGGGIAGLAAALRLTERGTSVILYESAALGGKMRTSAFAGRMVDEGPDAFLARVPWATDLATSVGLGERLSPPATGKAYVFVEGSLRAIPAAQMMGVPTDPDAPDLQQIIGPEARDLLRRDLDAPGPPPNSDESLGAFISRRIGEEVLDRLVAPLVAGINAGDVRRMSLAAVTPQLDAAARSSNPSFVGACADQLAAASASPSAGKPVFLAPQGGMATLVEALRAHLADAGVDIRVGQAVRALEPLGERRWRVIADPTGGGVGMGAANPDEVDAVVLATPPSVSSQLIADHSPTASEILGAIRAASVALATFSVDPVDLTDPLEGSGFLVPRGSGLLLTACSWTSQKWPALSPDNGDGTALLRASAGRDDDRRISELDDSALVAELTDDLARTMGLSGEPRAVRVTRWPSAFPQYDVGHLDRITAAEAAMAVDAPTIALAGCALRGVGIPASIRSGQVAADHVLATSMG